MIIRGLDPISAMLCNQVHHCSLDVQNLFNQIQITPACMNGTTHWQVHVKLVHTNESDISTVQNNEY